MTVQDDVGADRVVPVGELVAVCRADREQQVHQVGVPVLLPVVVVHVGESTGGIRVLACSVVRLRGSGIERGDMLEGMVQLVAHVGQGGKQRKRNVRE